MQGSKEKASRSAAPQGTEDQDAVVRECRGSSSTGCIVWCRPPLTGTADISQSLCHAASRAVGTTMARTCRATVPKSA
ncbi:hypothetical protein J5T34_01320 [Cupriavidus gilardii]|uniref:hypothetical protein n=1 Tax=Cupriavidus gilardii TaxID=82541 RepID=UPI001ABEBB4D|nr:hypothetical protein [Cupriavidus gilardii]MBO4119374.1 hypothetical protein [Cupriavidus gilardii]